jgi:hypothetical protein
MVSNPRGYPLSAAVIETEEGDVVMYRPRIAGRSKRPAHQAPGGPGASIRASERRRRQGASGVASRQAEEAGEEEGREKGREEGGEAGAACS